VRRLRGGQGRGAVATAADAAAQANVAEAKTLKLFVCVVEGIERGKFSIVMMRMQACSLKINSSSSIILSAAAPKTLSQNAAVRRHRMCARFFWRLMLLAASTIHDRRHKKTLVINLNSVSDSNDKRVRVRAAVCLA
jgi:hypothetical protein